MALERKQIAGKLVYVKKAEDPKQAKVGVVMREFKNGTLKTPDGKKVTSRKQAIAIAMSEAGISKDEKMNYKELVEEHERVVDVLESPSHEDDKKEAKTQKKELAGYKKKLKEGK